MDITSPALGELRTHWIITRSALDVATADVGAEDDAITGPVRVGSSFTRVRGDEEREP